MNFLTFEYFLAIVDTGSIKSASSLLHISQQALSEQVKRLEAELEVNLLTNTRPVQLTPCGDYFAKYCRDMLHQKDELTNFLKNMVSKKPEVLISVSKSEYPEYLTDVIADFINAYPECKITLVERPEVLSEKDFASYDFNISEEILDNHMINIPFDRYGNLSAEEEVPRDILAVLISTASLKKSWMQQYDEKCQLAIQTREPEVFSDLPMIKMEDTQKMIDYTAFGLENRLSGKYVVSTGNAEVAIGLCCRGIGAVILPYRLILQNVIYQENADNMKLFPLKIAAPQSQLYFSYDREKKFCEEEQAFFDLFQRYSNPQAGRPAQG